MNRQLDIQKKYANVQFGSCKVGCTPETVRSWVNKIEVDSATQLGVNQRPDQTSERAGVDCQELLIFRQLYSLFYTFFWTAHFNHYYPKHKPTLPQNKNHLPGALLHPYAQNRESRLQIL